VARQLLLRSGGLSQTTHPAVGAVSGAQGLLGRRGGADVGHAARNQTGAGGGAAGEIGDRPADLGAMADMVADHLCRERLLEGDAGAVHADAQREDIALVVVRGFSDRPFGSTAGFAAIPSADDDGVGAGATG